MFGQSPPPKCTTSRTSSTFFDGLVITMVILLRQIVSRLYYHKTNIHAAGSNFVEIANLIGVIGRVFVEKRHAVTFYLTLLQYYFALFSRYARYIVREEENLIAF